MDQIINAQFLELQHHRAEVGAENLGISVILHFILIGFLCVGGVRGGGSGGVWGEKRKRSRHQERENQQSTQCEVEETPQGKLPKGSTPAELAKGEICGDSSRM